MPVHDLRSDTVTKPTDAMRAAMAAAEVGDDCWGDDPTVKALESRVAGMLGKEAGVFLPSGTMANQIALHVHCRPGDALAAPAGAHVQVHESGSAAALSGVQVMPLGTRFGYELEDLHALCAEAHYGWPPVRLVWLENTLGLGGGKVWPIEAMEGIAAFAHDSGHVVHMDGARLWNAHVATGVPLARYGALTDTVSVCISKGLGAPVGSVLCGSQAIIDEARRKRYGFGGGMRQSGILAAAGLYALDHHLERLAEDHAHARQLADGIRDLDCWDVPVPDTNIVLAAVRDPAQTAEDLCAPLRERGVLVHPNMNRELRFLLHLGIDAADVPRIVDVIRSTCGTESEPPSGVS